jgi:hypothetical protein
MTQAVSTHGAIVERGSDFVESRGATRSADSGLIRARLLIALTVTGARSLIHGTQDLSRHHPCRSSHVRLAGVLHAPAARATLLAAGRGKGSDRSNGAGGPGAEPANTTPEAAPAQTIKGEQAEREIVVDTAVAQIVMTNRGDAFSIGASSSTGRRRTTRRSGPLEYPSRSAAAAVAASGNDHSRSRSG